MITHLLPVGGDTVNHRGRREKAANEDVTRAAAAAAISQFISILSLRGVIAGPRSHLSPKHDRIIKQSHFSVLGKSQTRSLSSGVGTTSP